MSPRLPLVDAPQLGPQAGRARLVRLGLAAGLLVVLVAALVVARGMPVQHSSFFPAGASGIVVLDFSTSIGAPGYRRITNVMRPVVEANQPIGVVYFSDVGYLALPPATPGRELRPFLRFLRTPPPTGPFPSEREVQRAERLAPIEENPWAAAFRGGTRISSGLEVARAAAKRAGIDGPVLLISDLDDSLFDLPALGEALAAYRRDGIRLRIVPLFPSAEDREYFRRAVGGQAFVTHAELLRNAQARQNRSLDADFPLPLLLLGVLLLVAVAVNETLCGRLDWRTEATT